MKPQQFTEQFLQLDEENDYVLKSVPCTFLDADNYCSIYEVRPKACREFPHTDRKKFQQISNLTLKNVAICPAAFNIVEKMKMPQGAIPDSVAIMMEFEKEGKKYIYDKTWGITSK